MRGKIVCVCKGVPQQKGMAHFFTDILPAVCTVLRVLDDRAFGEGTPCVCEKIQNNTKGDKANNIIDKGTIGGGI